MTSEMQKLGLGRPTPFGQVGDGIPEGARWCIKSHGKEKSSGPETMQLMAAVVERGNMQAAWKRVKGNKGAAGVDGLTVAALPAYLREHWPRIKAELLAGRYAPSPVRLVEIPKPGGGLRSLGIPTVLDRLIQQALHQVMQPLFDPDFSESSYGFRPGRSAWQAVAQAREYVAGGRRWVVDLDLEKFFDRVNHDLLLARVARKVGDQRVLRLIRRFLSTGVLGGPGIAPRPGDAAGRAVVAAIVQHPVG